MGCALWRDWREVRRLRALPPAARALVFYAEDGGSWPHLGPLVEELIGPLEQPVCYLTSSPHDPVLAREHPRLTALCVGDGAVRTWLFTALEAAVVVMTLPDLEQLHLKRSRAAPVHYVYVFHSLVSTHMIYRPGAFDHYDTLLCAGPHHVAELRAAEAAGGLAPRRLVEHGYGRLDTILAGREAAPAPQRGGPGRVVVAPSWGPHGLLETRGVEATRALLAAGFEVVVRPHPMTRRKAPAAIAALERAFAGEPRFALDLEIAGWATLAAADVLVSDWSGAALEFAFGLERPVVFVDVPRKVRNPGYEALGLEPLEVTIRGELGEVVAPGDAAALAAAVTRLRADAAGWRERLAAARARHVFHPGESAAVGAREVVARLREATS